ncbi:MAG: ABC transporter ATP-binding protein [Rhodospirillales bacterium]|nr:ABC transporter ATP-binding protein [Rhodospirillales bacterium]
MRPDRPLGLRLLDPAHASPPAPSGIAVDLRLARPVPLAARFAIRGVTVLLGASGAGKTTLLRALAGLVPAAGGPFAYLPAERRPIGYLPQGAGLFPHLTVWRNVAFALDGTRRNRRAAALAWLERLGLASLADRYPAQLSGGERQRVALLRALARHPSLLLLDEPTASLDAATGEAVIAELIARARAMALPALIASHDAVLAAMADHVAILHGGRLAQEGNPADLFAAPADPDCAALLGWRNLFAGIVREDGVTLDWPAAGVSLRLATHAPAGPARFAIPAGAPRLAPAGAGARENRIGGVLTARAALSDRLLVRIGCGTAELALTLPLAAAAGLGAPGEATALILPAEAIRVWPES